MENTLLIGDYLFVSKYSYGYSRFSLPFGPHLFDGRIWSAPPKRGDIVVFKLPRDNSTDYIKRVIGLPGDKIQVQHSVLYINGKAVPRKEIGTVALDRRRTYTQYQETCRTASATRCSTARPTACSTTPRSTRCRPTTIS